MERLCTNMCKNDSIYIDVLNFGLLGQAGLQHMRRFQKKNLHVFGGVLLCVVIQEMCWLLHSCRNPTFVQFWNLFLTNDDTKQSYSSPYSYLACTRFSSLHRVPLRKYMWTVIIIIIVLIYQYTVGSYDIQCIGTQCLYTPVSFHIVFGRHWLGDQK